MSNFLTSSKNLWFRRHRRQRGAEEGAGRVAGPERRGGKKRGSSPSGESGSYYIKQSRSKKADSPSKRKKGCVRKKLYVRGPVGDPKRTCVHI